MREGSFRWPELNGKPASTMSYLRDASLAVASFCSESYALSNRLRVDQRLLTQFQDNYAEAKSHILQQAAAGELSVGQTGDTLDTLSTIRRLIEQLLKGDEVLSSFSPKAHLPSPSDETKENQ